MENKESRIKIGSMACVRLAEGTVEGSSAEDPTEGSPRDREGNLWGRGGTHAILEGLKGTDKDANGFGYGARRLLGFN